MPDFFGLAVGYKRQLYMIDVSLRQPEISSFENITLWHMTDTGKMVH